MLPLLVLLGWISLPFAVWRISTIIVVESGPLDICDKFRYWVGVRYNEYNDPYGTNRVADLFTCIWCLSVWISAALVAAMILAPNVGACINLIFCGSALAIFFDAIMEKING